MGETKNVLTIDFDYIMWPCIKLYNDMCRCNQNPGETWERIEFERKINNHISYDAKTLKTIALIIKNAMKNENCTFYSIEEHQNLVKILNIEDSGDEYNVVNVDFHHDIYYHDEDVARLSYFEDCNCSNWLGYIHYIDKLKSYTWIKAPNSEPIPRDLDEELAEKISVKDSSALNELKMKLNKGEISFDYVVFCLSPQWVPYRYYHLFEIICDFVNKEV